MFKENSRALSCWDWLQTIDCKCLVVHLMRYFNKFANATWFSLRNKRWMRTLEEIKSTQGPYLPLDWGLFVWRLCTIFQRIILCKKSDFIYQNIFSIKNFDRKLFFKVYRFWNFISKFLWFSIIFHSYANYHKKFYELLQSFFTSNNYFCT